LGGRGTLDGGQLEAAIELLKQAIAFADIGECWTCLGSTLRESGDLDGAAAAIDG